MHRQNRRMAPSPESRVETADPDSNPNANTPMLTYNLFLLAHVLLFVYWLGGDIGVFYSSRYVADPSLSVEARTTALRIMAWIDEIPRICLVMILPVGVMLGYEAGWLRSSPVEITRSPATSTERTAESLGTYTSRTYRYPFSAPAD